MAIECSPLKEAMAIECSLAERGYAIECSLAERGYAIECSQEGKRALCVAFETIYFNIF